MEYIGIHPMDDEFLVEHCLPPVYSRKSNSLNHLIQLLYFRCIWIIQEESCVHLLR